MKIYTENVFATLLKIIGGGKFRKALRDAEKVAINEPGLEAELKQFSNDSAQLKADMEKFCKKYPDNPLCNGKHYGRTIETEY